MFRLVELSYPYRAGLKVAAGDGRSRAGTIDDLKAMLWTLAKPVEQQTFALLHVIKKRRDVIAENIASDEVLDRMECASMAACGLFSGLKSVKHNARIADFLYVATMAKIYMQGGDNRDVYAAKVIIMGKVIDAVCSTRNVGLITDMMKACTF